MGLLNPGGPIAQSKRNRCSISPVEVISPGGVRIEIGKDVRRTLQMKPAEFWIREDVYYTYACKNCEQETGEANI